MKQKFYSIVVLCTISLALIAPAHIKADSSKQTIVASQLGYWYDLGYSHGYDDAINSRPWTYTLIRTLIPEWEFCEYKAGYDQGWIDGGGGTPPQPGCWE